MYGLLDGDPRTSDKDLEDTFLQHPPVCHCTPAPESGSWVLAICCQHKLGPIGSSSDSLYCAHWKGPQLLIPGLEWSDRVPPPCPCSTMWGSEKGATSALCEHRVGMFHRTPSHCLHSMQYLDVCQSRIVMSERSYPAGPTSSWSFGQREWAIFGAYFVSHTT